MQKLCLTLKNIIPVGQFFVVVVGLQYSLCIEEKGRGGKDLAKADLALGAVSESMLLELG